MVQWRGCSSYDRRPCNQSGAHILRTRQPRYRVSRPSRHRLRNHNLLSPRRGNIHGNNSRSYEVPSPPCRNAICIPFFPFPLDVDVDIDDVIAIVKIPRPRREGGRPCSNCPICPTPPTFSAWPKRPFRSAIPSVATWPPPFRTALLRRLPRRRCEPPSNAPNAPSARSTKSPTSSAPSSTPPNSAAPSTPRPSGDAAPPTPSGC
mmetsp:Transcript_9561/g.19940  ORF Transcript_9561/g.19940 Transcript_9561/m.19940 type:complete len:205 (+) Transcript_9561:115-729(+)